MYKLTDAELLKFLDCRYFNMAMNKIWSLQVLAQIYEKVFLQIFLVSFTNSLTYRQKVIKFSIRISSGKCDQIRSFLWIWSYLLKKSLRVH